MKRVSAFPVVVVFFVLLMISGSLSVLPTQGSHLTGPVVGVWSSTYSTNIINRTDLGVGSSFTVDVNITEVSPTPGMIGYDFKLLYDERYIENPTINVISGTVFGESTFQVPSTQLPGEVRVAAVKLGPPPFSGINGTLAHITFRVKAVGVTYLGLTEAKITIATSPASPLTPPPATIDGYFQNISGKSGPLAEFTFTPPSPIQGDLVTFYANASIDPDNPSGNNKGITAFSWTWGDGRGEASPSHTISHTFGGEGSPQFGHFWVLLFVTDSDGFKGLRVRLVQVAEQERRDVSVHVVVSPTVINAGDQVQVTATVANLGTFNESSITLRVVWDQGSLITESFDLSRQGTTEDSRSFSATVQTSGLQPGPYEVVGTVQVAVDDNPDNNESVGFFRVATVTGSSGLLFAGVAGAIVSIIVAFGVLLRLRRSRSSTAT